MSRVYEAYLELEELTTKEDESCEEDDSAAA